MLILPNADRLMRVALIDPRLAFGQPGQYESFEGPTTEILARASAGALQGLEVRYYYRNLATTLGELVASQLIITHIPAGHVQPFHTHHTLHEFTIVMEGSVIAVDSDTLSESDGSAIRTTGRHMGVMDMVIEDPGVRHTIMNPNACHAITYTVQTARIPLAQFPHDWVRDKPVDVRKAA